MSMTTAEPKAEAPREKQLPAIAAPRLPYHPQIEERFGIDRASWRALVEAVFPNASNINSVIMALSYCRARKLDPFKRVVHIVPIWNKDLGRMIDTVWPGIGELRTTAFRTSEYAGRDRTVFGPDITQKVGSVDMTFPEWAQVSVYRVIKGQRVEFAGPQVYWLETYATVSRKDDSPNDMWKNRPRGQIDKCAEAAALRAAFPEEIGGDYIPEEIEHRNQQPAVEGKIASRNLDDLAEEIENGSAGAAQTSVETESQETQTLSEGEIDPNRPEDEQFAEQSFDLTAIGARFDACNNFTTIGQLMNELRPTIPAAHKDAVAALEQSARDRVQKVLADAKRKPAT